MKYLLLISAVLCSHLVTACDACGAASAMSAWGFMPAGQMHVVGMRSSLRWFESEHALSDAAHARTHEQFMRTELFGRAALTRRWQSALSIPLVRNSVSDAQGVRIHGGVGDISSQIAFLAVLPDEDKKVQHTFQISAGIKAPVGSFAFSHDLPRMWQPGTGTWDALAGVQYALRIADFGLMTELNARRNGTTSGHFHPGNAVQGISRIFYTHQSGDYRWVPSLSAQYEGWNPDIADTRYDLQVAYSGGYIHAASVALDVFAPRFTAGVEYIAPVRYQVGGGQSRYHGALQARVLYFISKRIKKQST